MEWIFVAASLSSAPLEAPTRGIEWKFFSRPPVVEVSRRHNGLTQEVSTALPESKQPVAQKTVPSSQKKSAPVQRKNQHCQCRPGYECGCLRGEACQCVGPPSMIGVVGHEILLQNIQGQPQAAQTPPTLSDIPLQHQGFHYNQTPVPISNNFHINGYRAAPSGKNC